MINLAQNTPLLYIQADSASPSWKRSQLEPGVAMHLLIGNRTGRVVSAAQAFKDEPFPFMGYSPGPRNDCRIVMKYKTRVTPG
jgi:hypothetical protein